MTEPAGRPPRTGSIEAPWPTPGAEGAPPFGRFFLPGPTEVHPDVLAAMVRPMIPHRGREMEALLGGIAVPLKQLFRASRPVLIGACSATGFMELAVRNGVRHRCLTLVGGAFGERFAHIAQACAKEVVRLEVPLGGTVEPEYLRDALRRTPVDAVCLVHSETSTGALAPLPELAAATREFPDVLLLVDAVTSLAGSPVETELWNLDFVLTGSQKALALPPGLALGVASERMAARAAGLRDRGLYFDLVAFEQAFAQGQPTNTPALPLLYALERQLRRIEAAGGVAARWARHEAMRATVERWVEQHAGSLGVGLLPASGRRSWTVSCVTLPPGKSGREVVQGVRRAGFVIGTGYGTLKERTVRIGHMGDHTPGGLEAVLAALAETLS